MDLKRYFGHFRMPVIILLLISWFSPLSCLAQSPQTINLNEVPHRKVRKYIEARHIDNMQDFRLIRASWNDGIDESGFRCNEKTFFLKDKLSHVWDCYRQANPNKSWNGRFVRFGLLISKGTNSAIYTNNVRFPEIDTGQVYFLDVRLLRGILNVPLAFEIINIDPIKRLMEFSYIEGNKSSGKQSIQFSDNSDGRIRITHTSYFKSNSNLRDNLLYPYFHKKFIREFHRNMKQLVLASAINL